MAMSISILINNKSHGDVNFNFNAFASVARISQKKNLALGRHAFSQYASKREMIFLVDYVV